MKTSLIRQQGLVLAMEQMQNGLHYLVNKELDDDEDYKEHAKRIASIIPRRLILQMEQLIEGPIFDGDITCKSDRDELLHLGLCIKVCCKGEESHNGATNLAYGIVKAYREMEADSE